MFGRSARCLECRHSVWEVNRTFGILSERCRRVYDLCGALAGRLGCVWWWGSVWEVGKTFGRSVRGFLEVIGGVCKS